MTQPENTEGQSTPPEGFGERQSAVPWYRQKWVRVVGGIIVGAVVILGPRLYNDYQANQFADSFDNVTDTTVSPEQTEAFIALNLSDDQVHAELQRLTERLGREPLTAAELATIKERAAEFDEMVANGASCDDVYKWLDGRYLNALGVVDIEGVGLLGGGIVGWGTADSWNMVIECEI